MILEGCIKLMKRKLFLLLAFACVFVTASADDSIKVVHPKFLSLNLSEGFVVPSSRIVKGKTTAPNVLALNLKYGLYAKGDKWEDYYFGMPYKGIGLYKPHYSMNKEMGNPFSVFLFQGATLKEFGAGLSLNYEINLGLSFNHNHYDVNDNPSFEALGSSVNAHLGGNLYLKKPISKWFDLRLGVDILHFSNGARRTPNYGLNSISSFVGLAYNMTGYTRLSNMSESDFPATAFEKRTVHDISFFVTRRTLNVDTTGANLRSRFVETSFKVVGLNYAYMWQNSRRFLWGPSMELQYDEGNGVSVVGDISGRSGEYKEIVKLGSLSERLSLGLSMKGEFKMQGFSVFGNLGYEVFPGHKKDKRLYQIYGVKVYLFEGLSSSFGVKSNYITNSNYLYLSIGYSFYKSGKNKNATRKR